MCEPLLFDVDDFGGGTFGAEYIVGHRTFVEAGGGHRATTSGPCRHLRAFQDADGSEIDSELKLQASCRSPATLEFVPTGRRAPIQPYIGAGIAALLWNYSETGEFVDPQTLEIFRDQFKADGTEVAPVIFGGVRAPIGASMMLGGEVRFRRPKATRPAQFLGDRIDLGGMTFQANLTWRF